MVDRGYRTGRKGQQFGRQKPKRAVCPDCGKKGLTAWKVTQYGINRYCQYCMRQENKHV